MFVSVCFNVLHEIINLSEISMSEEVVQYTPTHLCLFYKGTGGSVVQCSASGRKVASLILAHSRFLVSHSHSLNLAELYGLSYLAQEKKISLSTHSLLACSSPAIESATLIYVLFHSILSSYNWSS